MSFKDKIKVAKAFGFKADVQPKTGTVVFWHPEYHEDAADSEMWVNVEAQESFQLEWLLEEIVNVIRGR